MIKVGSMAFGVIPLILLFSCLFNGGVQSGTTAAELLWERYGYALEAISGMGLRLQALLDNDSQSENFIVSPVSATTIMAQIMLGADTEYADELFKLLLPTSQIKNDRINFYGSNNNTYVLPYSVLHIQLSQLIRALDSSPLSKFVLQQGNAIFVQKGVPLKEQYVRFSKGFYKSDVVELDFRNEAEKSYELINRWGEQHTHGLIKTFLAEPPTADTVAILANALYFRADWHLPFSDELNQVNYFNVSANKRVDVTYMQKLLEAVPYGAGENYKFVCLPYIQNQLGMYLVLPDAPVEDYDIREFAQRLSVSDLRKNIEQSQKEDVTIVMPKMYIVQKLSLLQPLQKYRSYAQTSRKLHKNAAPDRSEGRAQDDFMFPASEIQESAEPIYLTNAVQSGITAPINDIVQHIVLSVNEKGTEAAAISSSTVDYSGGSKNFRVTKPFLFFIRHEPTSAIIFWGTIKNPSP